MAYYHDEGYSISLGEILPALNAVGVLLNGKGVPLASDHPGTMIYCGLRAPATSNAIFTPLDIVAWNDQTPISSSAKLALEFRPRYDPISEWALARLLCVGSYLRLSQELIEAEIGQQLIGMAKEISMHMDRMR